MCTFSKKELRRIKREADKEIARLTAEGKVHPLANFSKGKGSCPKKINDPFIPHFHFNLRAYQNDELAIRY